MINFIDNKTQSNKVSAYFKVIIRRNPDLEYHKAPPQFSWDAYINLNSQFTSKIRPIQIVIVILMFISGITFSLPNVNADGPGIDLTFVQAGGNGNGEDYYKIVNGTSILWIRYFSEINDGTDNDSDDTNSTTQLSANWSTVEDDGIDYFSYAIGTTSGASNIVDYTNIGLSKAFTKSGLNLITGITYYTTVRAYNSNNEILESITSDGITVDISVPIISNIEVTPSDTSFTVSWETSETTTSIVSWGLTNLYGNIIDGDSGRTTQHEVTVNGLLDETAYHFMISGTDMAGNNAESSDIVTTTKASPKTVITAVQVANVSNTSVMVTWETNHAADSKVRYGLSTVYGNEIYESDLVTSHELIIADLKPNTQYHYEVLSIGNSVAINTDVVFSTLTENDVVPPHVPTILTPENEAIVNTSRPLITGVAESGNDIFLLLDRELIAVVKASDHFSGTGDFYYQIEEPLLFGKHSIIARARDINGLNSAESVELNFAVNPPYPTPTLQTPVLYDGSDYKVTIPGLAINGSQIRTYLNGEIVSTFNVVDDSSGTANFNALVENISVGLNVIEFDAVGLDGKVSKKSNPLSVAITETEKQVTKYDIKGDTVREEIFYEVSESDSLWSLSQQFYGDGTKWNHISYANQKRYPSLRENPSVIRLLWRLKIPTL